MQSCAEIVLRTPVLADDPLGTPISGGFCGLLDRAEFCKHKDNIAASLPRINSELALSSVNIAPFDPSHRFHMKSDLLVQKLPYDSDQIQNFQ